MVALFMDSANRVAMCRFDDKARCQAPAPHQADVLPARITGRPLANFGER